MFYNFKKEAKVYAYYGGALYKLDIYPDISFSQTFKETDYKKKTLHTPLEVYQGGQLCEANNVNFSFTTPLRTTTENTAWYFLMGPEYSTGTIPSFDLYIQLPSTIYKIEIAVIENVTYNLEMNSVLTISVTGTGSRLTSGNTLPAVPIYTNTNNYLRIEGVEVTIDDNTLDSIAALHLEINNTITWLPYYTLHDSLFKNLVYPTKYVLSERRVSGSITQFLTDTTLSQGFDYGTYPISVDIFTNKDVGGEIITFDLPETIFTRRLNVDDLITRVYDFRLTSGEIFSYPEI